MKIPTEHAIHHLLEPYLRGASVPGTLFSQLALYLDLLVRWNAKTNLTAIREPEEMVRRHFGESLFAGLHLPLEAETLLDFGTGAGFPGIPMQLLRPNLRVVLAESQGKKAAFLREAIRSLRLSSEVWPKRVEEMPVARRFDVVTLRAVDKMEIAMAAAACRVTTGGWLMVLASEGEGVAIPESRTGVVRLIRH